jgi:hypothetical protein
MRIQTGMDRIEKIKSKLDESRGMKRNVLMASL